jgi:hypothetical protein
MTADRLHTTSLARADHAMQRALQAPISANTETLVQNALDALRKEGADNPLLPRLEAIAVDLQIIRQATRDGRVNLCASRLARLRRSLMN